MGKASRRKSEARQAAAPQPTVTRERWEKGLIEATKRALARNLGGEQGAQGFARFGEGVDGKVDEFIEIFHSRVDDLRKRGQPLPMVACRKGCSDCCHTQRVLATGLEIARLAEWLRTEYPPEMLKTARERIAAYDVDVLVGSEGRPPQRIACPFLVDDACSIYPARPIGCRVFHSVDYSKCHERYEDLTIGAVPQFTGLHQDVGPITKGVQDGLAEAGLRGSALFFIKAIKIALEEPDAIDRYLAGEDVFEPASSPEIDEAIANWHFKPVPTSP